MFCWNHSCNILTFLFIVFNVDFIFSLLQDEEHRLKSKSPRPKKGTRLRKSHLQMMTVCHHRLLLQGRLNHQLVSNKLRRKGQNHPKVLMMSMNFWKICHKQWQILARPLSIPKKEIFSLKVLLKRLRMSMRFGQSYLPERSVEWTTTLSTSSTWMWTAKP